jgi:hypothetical protein
MCLRLLVALTPLQISRELVILEGHPVIHYDRVRVPQRVLDLVIKARETDMQVRYGSAAIYCELHPLRWSCDVHIVVH